MTMQVKVLFFSVLRDLVGAGQIIQSIELPEGAPATIRDLLSALYSAHPALESWDNSLLLAVNAEFATRDTPLSEGDEIALMPPVQGG
jgi:molybdopterin converting factor small subunit